MVDNRVSGWQRKRIVLGQVCCLLFLGSLAACTVEDNLNMADAFQPGLSGTVTDAVTKAGIAGATVSAQGKSAVTGANGFYVLGDFKAGTYKVKVSHSAYVDSEREISIQQFLQAADFQLQPK